MIAACFALVGFAAALVVGAAVGLSVATALTRGLGVMAACWIIGWMVGFIANRAIHEHIQAYKQEHPIPDDNAQDDADGHDGAADKPDPPEVPEAQDAPGTAGRAVSST